MVYFLVLAIICCIYSSLTAPRAEAAGVLSGASTLPGALDERGALALVPFRSDFEADGLRLWGYQSFGARSAPLSPVGRPVRARPAGAPPRLPNTFPGNDSPGTRGDEMFLIQGRGQKGGIQVPLDGT